MINPTLFHALCNNFLSDCSTSWEYTSHLDQLYHKLMIKIIIKQKPKHICNKLGILPIATPSNNHGESWPKQVYYRWCNKIWYCKHGIYYGQTEKNIHMNIYIWLVKTQIQKEFIISIKMTSIEMAVHLFWE